VCVAEGAGAAGFDYAAYDYVAWLEGELRARRGSPIPSLPIWSQVPSPAPLELRSEGWAFEHGSLWRQASGRTGPRSSRWCASARGV
jgi:hypothetical protein